MSRLSPRCLAFLGMVSASLLAPAASHADMAVLAMSSQVQYNTIIQGYSDPVYAYIYNTAATGSATLNYQAYATFPYGNSSTYSGTKVADGGTGYQTLDFYLNTNQVSPSTSVPISVTGTNTVSGGSVTLSGTVAVLAHADPAIYLNNQIVPLTAPIPAPIDTTVAPTTDAFSQAPPAGTELGASADPQLLGDPPPGVPTAELDLDSITSTGSPDIVTTLSPFTDLPSDDNPAEGVGFPITVYAPGPGDYDTTFYLHYSDEQDLPVAYAPGSEVVALNVNADVTDTTTTFVFSTPEPVRAAAVGDWRGGWFRRPAATPANRGSGRLDRGANPHLPRDSAVFPSS